MTSAFCGDFHESDSQVWKVGQRRWTIQEERNYSKWIEANITEDFFIRHEIRVDCADVPYALRWIYARINHLPAAATIEKNNQLIGHWSKDWAHLPANTTWDKDRRFRAALMTMLSSTSTRTMPFDTYPIQIIANSVTAGTTFLIAGDHAAIVSSIVKDGSTTHPVQTFEANLPTRIQRLQLRDFVFSGPDHDRVSGFVKFRWPAKTGNQWHYLPVKELPCYSEEQYSQAFTKEYADFPDAVAGRIDPQVYDANEKIEKVINTITRRLEERIHIVLDGNKKCREIQCPEGSRFWEIYNTRCRDEFIGAMLVHLEEIIGKNHLDRDAIFDEMTKIRLQISPDRFITLQNIFQNFKWMSPDPKASLEARWGLDKCSIINLQLKNAQESIAYIKEKYGKTDPQFAERSIWTQQKIIDDMTSESKENNCPISSSRWFNLGD